MRDPIATTIAALLVSTTTLSAIARDAGAQVTQSGTQTVTGAQALDTLRNATRAFKNLDSAVAAGYPRDVADCLVHEHHGAMGYHHLNLALSDAKVETARPEILLYERKPNGAYQLNGVEYIVPYRAWPRDSVAPTALGQQMKHEDNLKLWYLHAWAWTDNVDGVFADFNPSVQCPANAAKVFKPYP
ncbi:MAG TPA: hypothetical protein VGM50_08125 [Gemmatimonadaceae bacterium]|jgi:hypothetical protein